MQRLSRFDRRLECQALMARSGYGWGARLASYLKVSGERGYVRRRSPAAENLRLPPPLSLALEKSSMSSE